MAYGSSVALSSSALTPRFVADHAFIYFIIDNESGAILFMGKVTDPTALR